MKLDELKQLKVEELNYTEREMYENMLKVLEVRQLSLEDVRTAINRMKDGVAEELADLDEKSLRNRYLKARLKNLILLEKLLSAPTVAKEALEKALAGVDMKGKPSL